MRWQTLSELMDEYYRPYSYRLSIRVLLLIVNVGSRTLMMVCRTSALKHRRGIAGLNVPRDGPARSDHDLRIRTSLIVAAGFCHR